MFGKWIVFAGTLAVLIAFAGLGLNVTIFQSHISENTPRKILISIWISIPILVIGYLYYFIRYAPLQTVTYVSGKPEIVSAPYVVNTLAIFIITLISILIRYFYNLSCGYQTKRVELTCGFHHWQCT